MTPAKVSMGPRQAVHPEHDRASALVGEPDDTSAQRHMLNRGVRRMFRGHEPPRQELARNTNSALGPRCSLEGCELLWVLVGARPEIPHLRRRHPPSLLGVPLHACVARSSTPCTLRISERALKKCPFWRIACFAEIGENSFAGR